MYAKNLPQSSANALIIDQEGNLILQQRDDKPDIANPGLITMFGGTVELSESPTEALIRELKEELGITVDKKKIIKFKEYKKSVRLDGIDLTVHVYLINNIDFSQLKLFEGKSFIRKSSSELIEDMTLWSKLTRIMKIVLDDYRNYETKLLKR